MKITEWVEQSMAISRERNEREREAGFAALYLRLVRETRRETRTVRVKAMRKKGEE